MPTFLDRIWWNSHERINVRYLFISNGKLHVTTKKKRICIWDQSYINIFLNLLADIEWNYNRYNEIDSKVDYYNNSLAGISN